MSQSPAPQSVEQMQQTITRYQTAGLALEREKAELEQAKKLLEQKLAERTLKPPPPPVFKGHMGYDVDSWVRSMVKQFNYDPIAFPQGDHARRINAAVMYLDGAASDWWEHEDKSQITTWDQFVNRLCQRFRPVQAAEIARTRLKALKQSGAVSEYCNRFQKEIAPIKNMQVDEQLFWFKDGLSPSIRSEVVKSSPTSLHAAMDAAVKAEAYLGQARGGQYTYRPSYSSSYSRPASSAPMEISAMAEESMDAPPTTSREQMLFEMVEAMQKKMNAMMRSQSESSSDSRVAVLGKARVPNRSKEDVAHLMREGRCINCCGKGHMKKECNKPWQPMPKNV
jgi:hypothetical protein